ncbi:MAG TPA: hypothetical protein DDW52_16290 [Planctomycetaceae bacterium]|nr:hypothetical protein [Planctomycetaceae bacterium]
MEIQQYSDFDEFGAAIAGADIDVQLMRPYERYWTIRHWMEGDIHIQHCVEGSSLHSRGAIAPEGWAVFAPLNDAPTTVNGEELAPGSIVLMPAGTEFYIHGEGRSEYSTLFLPEDLIVPDGVSRKAFNTLRIVPSTDSAKQLLATIRRVTRLELGAAHSDSSTGSSTSIAEQLASELRQVVGTGFPSPLNANGKSSRRSPALVSKALELINGSSAPITSVSMLSSLLRVSPRSLLAAFRRELGIAPETYLLNHRLHRARRMLLRSTPDNNTVSTVVSKCGFTDPGRFAGRYQKLFGELPSKTLQRKAV